jgi:hypothetical protein
MQPTLARGAVHHPGWLYEREKTARECSIQKRLSGRQGADGRQDFHEEPIGCGEIETPFHRVALGLLKPYAAGAI